MVTVLAAGSITLTVVVLLSLYGIFNIQLLSQEHTLV